MGLFSRRPYGLTEAEEMALEAPLSGAVQINLSEL
jgi:hypothetical protein